MNGLRAFEAAARHGSFTLAAKDLHVTQAAVSQQVRLLEERLGFALFRRRANRLELTDQGRAFQPGLTEAFDAIAKLVEEAAAMRPGSVLTVGVAPNSAPKPRPSPRESPAIVPLDGRIEVDSAPGKGTLMRIVLERVLARAALRAAEPELDDVQFRAITLAPRNGVRVVLDRPPAPRS